MWNQHLEKHSYRIFKDWKNWAGLKGQIFAGKPSKVYIPFPVLPLYIYYVHFTKLVRRILHAGCPLVSFLTPCVFPWMLLWINLGLADSIWQQDYGKRSGDSWGRSGTGLWGPVQPLRFDPAFILPAGGFQKLRQSLGMLPPTACTEFTKTRATHSTLTSSMECQAGAKNGWIF
jgi:hypothetical protein